MNLKVGAGDFPDPVDFQSPVQKTACRTSFRRNLNGQYG